MTSNGDSVLHAYGVVEGAGAGDLPLTGIGQTPVRLVEVGDLSIIVGDLPSSEYGEAAWAEHAQDPAWLEPVARGHHDVLQTLVEDADVLPLRLPGIYPDEQTLSDAFTSAHDDLIERLCFVSGHREWSVHVFLESEDTGEPETATPASGRDYLLMRKQQVEQKGSSQQERQVLAIEVYEGLNRTSRASVVNLVQDRALSGRTEPMLLNSAHLVARDEEQDFLAVAVDLDHYVGATGGLRVEVSGPWPPYNFTHVSDEPRMDGGGP